MGVGKSELAQGTIHFLITPIVPTDSVVKAQRVGHGCGIR